MTLRKLRLLGAIGVSRKASVSGWEIGPPAEREYAVDPVGVERRSPSAWKFRQHRGVRSTSKMDVKKGSGDLRLLP